MKRFPGLSSILASAMLLAAALAPGTASAQTSATAATTEPAHQILVMLRRRPPHFRPNGDYGANYDDALSQQGREKVGRTIARAHGLQMAGAWPMPVIGLDCIIMTVPDGRTKEQAAAEVSRDPAVEWAEPVRLYQTQAAPEALSDPLYQAEPAARLWQLASLHRVATGRGVTVAVIDTRIDASHPDLAGQVAVAEDFVDGRPSGPETHGTAVAGIIAAKAGNGVGIVGVAPDARLMGLRACWQLSSAVSLCDSLSLAKALHFAIEHRAEILNLSLSGPADPLLGRLIDASLARGQTVVASYDPKLPNGGFPAMVPGVVAVTDKAVAPMPANLYQAPGRGVPTTEPGGKWNLVDGSSFAAAHVSGLAALARQRHKAGDRKFKPSVAGPDGSINAWMTVTHIPLPCGVARSCQVAAEAHP